jgi:hypothetical protein
MLGAMQMMLAFMANMLDADKVLLCGTSTDVMPPLMPQVRVWV